MGQRKTEKSDRLKPLTDSDSLAEHISSPEAVRAHFKEWFPKLSPKAVEALVIYYCELMKFNKAVNLISISSVKNAESVHFADSILASQLVYPAIAKDHPVFDLGSGNGFPGLVFGVLYPETKVILVDRDMRKIEFLKHMIAMLKLKNVSTSNVNLEEMAANCMWNVISRGFAPLQKALLISRKQVCVGGKFFHLKGDGWATELAGVTSQLFSYWSPSLFGKYRVPDSGVEGVVFLTEKISE